MGDASGGMQYTLGLASEVKWMTSSIRGAQLFKMVLVGTFKETPPKWNVGKVR